VISKKKFFSRVFPFNIVFWPPGQFTPSNFFSQKKFFVKKKFFFGKKIFDEKILFAHLETFSDQNVLFVIIKHDCEKYKSCHTKINGVICVKHFCSSMRTSLSLWCRNRRCHHQTHFSKGIPIAVIFQSKRHPIHLIPFVFWWFIKSKKMASMINQWNDHDAQTWTKLIWIVKKHRAHICEISFFFCTFHT